MIRTCGQTNSTGRRECFHSKVKSCRREIDEGTDFWQGQAALRCEEIDRSGIGFCVLNYGLQAPVPDLLLDLLGQDPDHTMTVGSGAHSRFDLSHAEMRRDPNVTIYRGAQSRQKRPDIALSQLAMGMRTRTARSASVSIDGLLAK